MNYCRFLLIIALMLICFNETSGRFLLPSKASFSSRISNRIVSDRLIKKRPKIPKPCKNCGGGDDDGTDNSNSDSDSDDDSEPSSTTGPDDGSGGESNSSTTNQSEGNECFPFDSKVTLSSDEEIRMKDLKVGQSVKNYDGTSSMVYGFSHKDNTINAQFLRFITKRGNLTVTRGHYVYVRQKKFDSYSTHSLIFAREIKKGDFLVSDRSSELSKIENIEIISGRGLYNPHTLSGELIVDGFRVSTYTQAMDPISAASFLTPFRAFFQLFKADILTSGFSHGCPRFIRLFYRELISTSTNLQALLI